MRFKSCAVRYRFLRDNTCFGVPIPALGTPNYFVRSHHTPNKSSKSLGSKISYTYREKIEVLEKLEYSALLNSNFRALAHFYLLVQSIVPLHEYELPFYSIRVSMLISKSIMCYNHAQYTSTSIIFTQEDRGTPNTNLIL